MKVEDKWVICDKKTTGSIGYFSKASSKPSDSHKDQINRYRVLLHKCYGIDATFGCVIYISNKIEKDVRDKPIAMTFKLAPYEEIVEDMKQKAATIKEALLEKKLPERTKCFLCDGMCPYASKCFTDNREYYDV
jgi:CRISPR/Cas system-associated exonuclease Cas4 (RecB family)